MNTEEISRSQIRKYLTYMISFETVYNKFSDFYMSASGSCFCPFHDNEHSAAAKFYRESNTLYCYADCQLYTVYDLLNEFNQNPEEIFWKLWNSYSDTKKQSIIDQAGKPYSTKCTFKDSVIAYDSSLITYDDLRRDIYDSIDGLKETLIILYNISRPVTERNLDKVSDYIWLGAFKQNTHIRCITSGELINHTKDLPRNICWFIKEHNDVTIVFNMYDDKPVGATLRGNKTKAFMDLGNAGGVFYNLLNLKNFHKGDPIVLVEGPKDCEAFKIFYRNRFHCLSLMTANLTTSQLLVLRALTDKVILCLDNDETGHKSREKFKKKYAKYFDILEIEFPSSIKDFGDLITLYRKNKKSFEPVYRRIESQLP